MNAFLSSLDWRWSALGALAVLALCWLLYARIRKIRQRRAIDNVISSVAVDELRNVLLPTGTGEQIHVNHLMLTQRGLLVLEFFDVPGMIFAGEKMERWSVLNPKRHFMFSNPMPLVEDRLSAVRYLAGDHVPVEARILFSMRGEFPKGRPDMVIRIDELQEQFPVVDKTSGAAAAFAGVWQHIKSVSVPNPLAD